jgi:MFS family permease
MSMPPPSSPSSAPPRRALLWLVALGFFMQTLDATIVNTALPAMARDLQESPLQMHSVIVAYSLAMAVLIPASGWLADRFGTRRVFMSAIALFVLGSVLCALSPTLPLLVGARVVQGLGGALLLPVGRLAVLRAFPRDEFIRAMSFVAARRFMAGGDALAVRAFDAVGYGLLAFGMAAVSLAVEGMAGGGVRGASALVMLVFGLASLAAYWLHALRSGNPLFAPGLFTVRTLRVGLLGNLFSRLGSSCMPFMIPLVLQVSLGFAPLQAGLMMLPTVLGSMAVKPLVTRLVRRHGYREVLVANTCMLALLIASFAFLTPGQSLPLLVVQLALFGSVNSMQFSAMNTVTLKDLDTVHASSGNSLLSMVQMLAMGMGVAVAGAVLASFEGYFSQGETLWAFRATFACMGVLTLAATALFLQLPPHEPPRPRPLGPEEQS